MTSPDSERASTFRRTLPALTLVVLSPLISELLSGSTRISTSFVIIPEMGIWGCGALLIRYFTRIRHKGWYTMLILGVALALAEELIIQQTSLAPLPGVAPGETYARFFGVNWLYLLWAVGYESVWVVVIPVLLTELIFPSRRSAPWVGRRGIALASVYFVSGASIAWYSWTRIVLPTIYHSSYQPPALSVLAGLAAIMVLVFAASKVNDPHRALPGQTRAPRQLVVGAVVFLLSLAWSSLLFIAYGATPSLPPGVPVAGGLTLAFATLALMRRWLTSAGWSDVHSLGLVLGGIAGSALMGVLALSSGGAIPSDLMGDIGFNAIALILLVRFSQLLGRRGQQ